MLAHSIAIITQTSLIESFPLPTTLQDVFGCTVECISIEGITNAGSTIALVPSFLESDSLKRSIYNQQVVNVGWVQPYPLPQLSNQIQSKLFKFERAKSIHDFELRLISEQPIWVDGTFKAVWMISFYYL